MPGSQRMSLFQICSWWHVHQYHSLLYKAKETRSSGLSSVVECGSLEFTPLHSLWCLECKGRCPAFPCLQGAIAGGNPCVSPAVLDSNVVSANEKEECSLEEMLAQQIQARIFLSFIDQVTSGLMLDEQASLCLWILGRQIWYPCSR